MQIWAKIFENCVLQGKMTKKRPKPEPEAVKAAKNRHGEGRKRDAERLRRAAARRKRKSRAVKRVCAAAADVSMRPKKRKTSTRTTAVEVAAHLGGNTKAASVRKIIRTGKLELPRHPKEGFLVIAPRTPRQNSNNIVEVCKSTCTSDNSQYFLRWSWGLFCSACRP
jgi:hypothetical protein